MLSVQELEEVKQYVLRELPRVLEQDPQFVLFIEGILSEKFPRRDEFARLLDEFTSFRQETRERFDRVDADIHEIKSDVAVLKTDVGVLKIDVGVLKTDMAGLKGESVERRYRERPYAYFGRILRRIRGLRDDELARLLEEAAEQGAISEEDAEDIRLLDAIVLGRNTQGQQAYLAVEASAVIDEHDVARAVRRAGLLAKATGEICLPVVAGDSVTPGGLLAIQQAGLWRVIHGAALSPDAQQTARV